MNKLIKNTILIIGLLLCAIVLIINIFATATISNNTEEVVKTEINSPIQFIITGIVLVFMYIILDMTKEIKISKNGKIIAIISVLIIYLLLQILWINVRGSIPSSDQKMVYSAATKIANGEADSLIKSEYFQALTQQLTLPTFFALIFKITSSQSPVMLQYLNAIANTFTILAIFLITKELGKKYKISRINSLIISVAFVSLPLLSTFVYGDLIGLPMCLFAVYFMMKYTESRKMRYAIISMICMAMGYVTRMNNLIFIISLGIYLLLDILNLEKEKIFKGIAVLILFVTISMLPATIIKQYWKNRLQLDTTKEVPITGYICMGMIEGERANGWYDYPTLQKAFEDAQNAKQEYQNEIVARLKEFISNPIYCISFYTIKTASMWAENTYAAIWYNQSYMFGVIEEVERTSFQVQQTKNIDNIVMKSTQILSAYQKALILIIFGITILALIKNRKNLSNEILLLVTIFIGGFLFHTIWEAKSRYIIPYIVVLIPITSIVVEDYIKEIVQKIKTRKINKIGNGEKNEIINSNSNLQ